MRWALFLTSASITAVVLRTSAYSHEAHLDGKAWLPAPGDRIPYGNDFAGLGSDS